MCLSLMRTGAGEIKYAVFNVLNRFQTYSNSIDCTVTTFDVSLCNFFSQCAIFFYAHFGLCKFFFSQIFSLPPPPPPPHPPRDQLVRPLPVFRVFSSNKQPHFLGFSVSDLFAKKSWKRVAQSLTRHSWC